MRLYDASKPRGPGLVFCKARPPCHAAALDNTATTHKTRRPLYCPGHLHNPECKYVISLFYAVIMKYFSVLYCKCKISLCNVSQYENNMMYECQCSCFALDAAISMQHLYRKVA